jgi:hypothetical protein
MRKNTAPASMTAAERERREFLRKFGRFAAATPPLITAVLSAPALADDWQSGGHHHCHHQPHCEGGGQGDGDGDGGGRGWGGDGGWGGGNGW